VVDSQIVDYLIAAVYGGEQPSAADAELAAEQTATLRLYLWGEQLVIGCVASREIRRTASETQRERLQGLINQFLDEVWIQASEVRLWHKRARDLRRHHRGRRDCLIVAEAELTARRFLTNDRRAIGALRALARIPMMTPVARWNELAVQRGTPPRLSLHPTNPLVRMDFWRWD